MSSKFKFILLVVLFAVFAVGMYAFGYNVMAAKNQLLADSIAQRNIELEVLKREQISFEQGKIDLAILEKSQYPPDELFSRDTKVVKEIQQLEAAAQRYDLDLKIAVAGSVKDAKPVEGTSAGLFVIPYSITVDGTPDNILMFIQATERMPFLTHVNTLSINVESAERTTAIIRSEFYIKK